MANRRTKGSPGRITHADHDHPQTAHYRSLCRAHVIEHGEPLVTEEAGSPMEAHVTEPPLTRGQKGAATRARNKAAAERAQAVDAVLDLTEGSVPEGRTEPRRNGKGRFTRSTLGLLLASIEGAETYLEHEGAELVEATLTSRIGGQLFVATFDGSEWSVEVK